MSARKKMSVMAYSHCTGMGPEPVQGTDWHHENNGSETQTSVDIQGTIHSIWSLQWSRSQSRAV